MVLKDEIVTVTYGNSVGLYDVTTFDLLRTHNLPSPVYSASIHFNQVQWFTNLTSFFSYISLITIISQRYFVCGGEDCLVYKVCCETGKVIESYKKHFGPIHCIRYSPDGELYASGSEDGTIRLWQNCVGKTYGLWQRPELGGAANNNHHPGTSPGNHDFVVG